jgi:hypothetical protein
MLAFHVDLQKTTQDHNISGRVQKDGLNATFTRIRTRIPEAEDMTHGCEQGAA